MLLGNGKASPLSLLLVTSDELVSIDTRFLKHFQDLSFSSRKFYLNYLIDTLSSVDKISYFLIPQDWDSSKEKHNSYKKKC